MTVPVKCLINRYWDPAEKDWAGEEITGMLIEIATQTDEHSDKIVPVGIVVLDDTGVFQSVPVEFITEDRT